MKKSTGQKIAKKTRAKCNKLSCAERQRLTKLAVQTIEQSTEIPYHTYSSKIIMSRAYDKAPPATWIYGIRGVGALVGNEVKGIFAGDDVVIQFFKRKKKK